MQIFTGNKTKVVLIMKRGEEATIRVRMENSMFTSKPAVKYLGVAINAKLNIK